MSSEFVFDVTTADFETDVVRRSLETPVLLDFWADWCEPCKTLSPVLEAIADEYGGSFVVGKINSETETQLAQAFQVRSIPFGVLIAQGQPVDAFTGALGEKELREFLARAGIQPAELQPSEPDPDSPEAKYAAALAAISKGDAVSAEGQLQSIDPDSELAAEAGRLLEGLVVFDFAASAASPPAAVAIFKGAELLRQGRVADAVESFLASIGEDKSFADGLARKAVLMSFALLDKVEDADELLSGYRRQLATLLY
ncbi:MAG: tetratricopeptide repeat protein [Planctomycetota bacterium]|jgi:putative thioredoxin